MHGPEPEEQVLSVLSRLRERSSCEVRYVSADFANLDEVSAFGDDIARSERAITLLINNAGVPGLPERTMTVDEHERTLQVNCYAQALLTAKLLPAITRDARIVNVGSGTHHYESLHFDDLTFDESYEAAAAYYRSKLAMVTYSMWLANHLRRSGVNVVTACPGVNDTALIKSMFGEMGSPVEVGAAYLLDATIGEYATGTYTHEGAIETPSAEATDAAVQEELIHAIESAIGLSLTAVRNR
ncbi:NAD(P)-dependent dehydrogenase (short-subunit alcohol dehydrogenase family) [Rhodococcus erythropolis]|nr:NAD(P)-dependent dehydrogenase (short-subunit alcohol dehydrogenase family) [Rhodococcus erythropolis]